MKNKFILTISIITFGICAALQPALAYATDCSTNICDCDNVSDQLKAANGCPGYEELTDLPSVIENIVNGIILSLGIIAVVFVLIGGINYMTSAGDPGKTQKAKNTIIYAAVGLIICVLAYAIVNFVIGIIE